jgi:hypothetical protein
MSAIGSKDIVLEYIVPKSAAIAVAKREMQRSPQSGPLQGGRTGKVLVAGWIRIVPAARSVISAGGRGADGSSTDAHRYAAGYGSVNTTAIGTTTINASAMNAAVIATGATDAGAATASISKGVS